MSDIVERMRKKILADAHERGEIGGVLAERLIRERQEAADEIERLRASLQAFVTFHSGHVLPPELVNAMLLAREALGDGLERSGI